MNSGKQFEKDWKKSIENSEQPIYFLRLQDSPSSFGQDSHFVRFTNRNPYDSFCFFEGNLFCTELKHTKNTSFSFQTSKEDKSQKMIKWTQIKGLERASEYNGVFAGFIFDIDKGGYVSTYWLNIKDFLKFFSETGKKSINEKDIQEYNGLPIQSRRLKVSYRYDVLDMFIKIRKGSDNYGEKDQ